MTKEWVTARIESAKVFRTEELNQEGGELEHLCFLNLSNQRFVIAIRFNFIGILPQLQALWYKAK